MSCCNTVPSVSSAPPAAVKEVEAGDPNPLHKVPPSDNEPVNSRRWCRKKHDRWWSCATKFGSADVLLKRTIGTDQKSLLLVIDLFSVQQEPTVWGLQPTAGAYPALFIPDTTASTVSTTQPQ